MVTFCGGGGGGGVVTVGTGAGSGVAGADDATVELLDGAGSMFFDEDGIER
jgi:hypothetical protein